MERDAYRKLLAWKKSKTRKPLVVRGARQVGKTYLLKAFGKDAYENYVYLNFEENPTLADFFDKGLKPAKVIDNIRIFTNIDIQPDNTLIILDEIQAAPSALTYLKYFQEEANQYHIVSAGSLLGVKLSNTSGFPVGKVNFMDLYPLSFFEFLKALQQTKLYEFLSKLDSFVEIPLPIHEELIVLLKKYMFIGGMPEAIAEYLNSNDLTIIRQIQKEILDAYMLDFAKHAPAEQILKIRQVWESIPGQLAKENKKFIFSALKKSARGREYETAIQWLLDAGLIIKSYNISKPTLPLSGFADKHTFKVFLLDVGLLSAMSNIPAKFVVDENKLFSEFQGAFSENYVAQEFTAIHFPSYYWTSDGMAEVDFVVEHELNAYPIEVKAGMSKKKKSLLVYREKYHPKALFRASLMNLRKDGDIRNIPLYLVSRFEAFTA